MTPPRMTDLNAVDVARTDEPTDGSRDIATLTSAVGNIERAVAPIWLLVVLAFVVTLWWCQVVLIPIVLSILIGYALGPLVERLVSWRVPRALAVLAVMCTLVGVFGGSAYALRGQAAAFVERVPSAAHMVSQTIRSITRGEPGTVQKMQAAARELETATAGRRASDGVTPVRVEEPTFRWSDWLWSGSRSAGELVAQMFSVLCLTYYLLAAGDLYKRKLVRMVPTLSDKRVTVQILADIDRQIERFLIARAAVSLIVGMVIWGTFILLGVDDAAVWGVVAGVLVAIPLVGPDVSGRGGRRCGIRSVRIAADDRSSVWRVHRGRRAGRQRAHAVADEPRWRDERRRRLRQSAVLGLDLGTVGLLAGGADYGRHQGGVRSRVDLAPIAETAQRV